MGFSGLDKPGRLAKEVTHWALEVMSQPSRRPRFLFLNYFDTHQPYEPPEEFARKFGSPGAWLASPNRDPIAVEQMVSLYDAGRPTARSSPQGRLPHDDGAQK
ncbi:MAG: hypothetical protein ACM3U2_13400 [Deltaproteobacteria bacterium]